MPRASSVQLAIFFLLVIGCTRTPKSVYRSPGPTTLSLRQVDSTLVRETNTDFVGHPMKFAVGPEGSFYIADALATKVFRFSRNGVLMRTYGRRGTGAGEFGQPGAIGFVGDSLLVTADAHSNALLFFDLATGAYKTTLHVPGLPSSITAGGGVLWVGALDLQRHFGVARMGTSTMVATGQIVPWPPSYEASPGLARFHISVYIAPFGDTLAVGFGGENGIREVTSQGVPIRTVGLPVISRRGVPENAGEIFDHRPTMKERFAVASGLVGLRLLSSGQFITVHFDEQISGSLITGKGFVSLLTHDLSKACVDAPLVFAQDAQPRIAFRGDTLFALDRQIVGAGVSTYVRSYVVDASRCQWLPTTRL